jgi:hypothetical protein
MIVVAEKPSHVAEQVGFEPTVRHNRTPDFECVTLYGNTAGSRASTSFGFSHTVRRQREMRLFGQGLTLQENQ